MKGLRVLVTGSRKWGDADAIKAALREVLVAKRLPIVELLHGNCAGADLIADAIGKTLLGCTVTPFPVGQEEREKYGAGAYLIRNIQMVETKPDVVLAFFKYGEKNRGTSHCSSEAKKRGIPVNEYWRD
jgi:hypothetical protein